MIRLPRAKPPRVGLGITSLVLGMIALLLFFLPVLGIPLSALGMFLGVVGVAVALGGGGVSLRWSVLGLGLCGMALGINFAIAYAPSGEVEHRDVPRLWQGVYDRPRVPPPARPGSLAGEGAGGHAPPPREARQLDAPARPHRD
jgi:hypothetical protein